MTSLPKLGLQFPPMIQIVIQDNRIDSRKTRTYHGLDRVYVANFSVMLTRFEYLAAER